MVPVESGILRICAIMFRFYVLLSLCVWILGACSQSAPDHCIIDVHRHLGLWPDEKTRNDWLESTVNEMNENQIEVAVALSVDDETAEIFRDRLPDRLLFSVQFPGGGDLAWPDIDTLRIKYESGDYVAMGEMMFVYQGTLADAPEVDPYWELAQTLGVPVGIHLGPGPPPGVGPRSKPGSFPNFNPYAAHPERIKSILTRWPDLKIWIMHAGFRPPIAGPDLEANTFALLREFPSVKVDMTVAQSIIPKPEFEDIIFTWKEAGFIDRIMFGTDGYDAGPIIERYMAMDFLSETEKRKIFSRNAEELFDIQVCQ